MPTDPKGDAKPPRRAKAQKIPAEIRIKVSWCKGCGLCVDYCKTGVLAMEQVLPKVVQAEKCNWCLQCEAICPDFAIEVAEAAVVTEAATEAVAATGGGSSRGGSSGGTRT